MIIDQLHDFNFSFSEAIKLQNNLASKIIREDQPLDVKLIAGVDVSIGRQGSTGRAAVVVMHYPSFEIAASSVYEGEVNIPYIPGLLSFRELPLIIPTIERLNVVPDLFIVDGQGIAHPRRLGIASHLGLFTGKPTIGCAKSRLCGEHAEVGMHVGDSEFLVHGDDVIGKVVRTKKGCKLIYISIGHRISLETALNWVLKLCKTHRLPEPVRQAHMAAGRYGTQ
ncbi:deoxyribonuclease V [Dehalogenimonas etheniformans]|uniref:Endonuclease V n=1 Tax=Dehalogenimonas etheniformans TaxID=1536648 RepID=A0A2P5P9I7_9CHLR|nr:deoxyribonuclease V [Dehalogenimonas etheniformans]PPD58944.1 deoxyribonuclease V [Dehalogenimonas etheniformans]QNT76287.1 deoxyribonuclease V [Dehalogenimonas etheniformans]